MFTLSIAFALALCCTSLFAQPKTLIEWTFDKPGDPEGWVPANHIQELRVAAGALQGRLMDWDPFLRGPQFEIAATPYQRIELRMKTDCEGGGEVFWTNTTESAYGGFSPGKETPFQIIGDGQWHEYRIYPFWHNEKKIILLRLDFARPADADKGTKTFAVDYLRIVDLGTPTQITADPVWDFTKGGHGWEAQDGGTAVAEPVGLRFTNGPAASAFLFSGALKCPLEDRFWVHLEMKVDKGSAGYVKWVSSEHANVQSAKFPLKADGQLHSYNLDLSSYKEWSGDALLLGLQPTNAAGATARIQKVAVSLDPQGPPEVECSYVGLEDALNRAGRPVALILTLLNRGGETATNLRIAALKLPAGLTVADKGQWRNIGPLDPFEPTTHRILLQSAKPIRGAVAVRLEGAGAPKGDLTGSLEIAESLNLPKADYVPKPQPVESDYEVGALYFPGWPSMAKWEPIRRDGPERKPVLGWYDEGNPECVDWQIKWAAEHGIKYFLVDWYWSAGGRHLEHWVEAYKKARYRGHLKWAMMWANHNPVGSHSDADMRAVAKYWVDNYFNMPEYYRIDDKPVVMIWSPAGIRRDLGGADGGKRALEIAREVARDAGYKGIYFIAMKWPEASTDPGDIRPLKDDGYDMTSIYHYMANGGKAEDPQHFPFELCAESSYPFWKARQEADLLPFLPNLSTGWDSRPWHGDKATVVYGRTVPLFRKICEDAKRFADETGVKRLMLAPLNEWGEGSYAEPNKEFGFGMYDAVRDVFCKQPAGGWPPNLAPADVGRGPYDWAEPERQSTVAWTFANSAEGWGPFMGVTNFRQEDGAIHFETVSDDPAVGCTLYKADARKYKYVVLRMKIDSLKSADEQAQLFWSTPPSGVSEPNSIHFDLIGDGQYHDYVLPVGENSRWRGKISTFRFDPCNHKGAEVSIAEVRLSESAPPR